MKLISTDGLLRAILVIWLGGLLSCGEAPSAADQWFVGWLIGESSDLNTTAQSSAHSNPHAFRVRGDSLEWITFASPTQMRSFSRQMFPISRRSDTLWLPPDFSKHVSYLLLSDTFATVVDSQHHLRLAERDFLPVRPTEESVSLPKLAAELQSSAYQILSPDQHLDLAVLDESRVALRDAYDGYQEIESYYLSNVAGGTFLVLDNKFMVSKVQILGIHTDSISGYLYGAFGGPVVLQRLRDPVVDGNLLLGSWEFEGMHFSSSDDSNAATRQPPIQSLTVTDSIFAYRLADRWFTYPYELIESTGMILLPDDRLWLVTALTDSTLEVISDGTARYPLYREQRFFFRRPPKNNYWTVDTILYLNAQRTVDSVVLHPHPEGGFTKIEWRRGNSRQPHLTDLRDLLPDDDLSWVRRVDIAPPGEYVPARIDPETGDILGDDPEASVIILQDGLLLYPEESDGGLLIYLDTRDELRILYL